MGRGHWDLIPNRYQSSGAKRKNFVKKLAKKPTKKKAFLSLKKIK